MRQTTSVRNASNAFLQDAFRFHNRALWHGARQKPTLSSSKNLADGSTVMVYPARETTIRDCSVSKVARIVQRHGTNWVSDTLDESRKQKQ